MSPPLISMSPRAHILSFFLSFHLKANPTRRIESQWHPPAACLRCSRITLLAVQDSHPLLAEAYQVSPQPRLLLKHRWDLCLVVDPGLPSQASEEAWLAPRSPLVALADLLLQALEVQEGLNRLPLQWEQRHMVRLPWQH